MNSMSYRGYSAVIQYDDDDAIFFGRIAGIRDGVAFHADTVPELRAAFREAVDDYVATCAKVGKPPSWQSDRLSGDRGKRPRLY